MRKRSISIHAQNAENYLDNLKENEAQNEENDRRRLKRNLSEIEGRTQLEEDEEVDEYLGVKNIPTVWMEVAEKKNAEIEEKELFEQLENINNVYRNNITSDGTHKTNSETGLSVLCSYFKERIRKKTDEKEEDSNLIIYSSVKKSFVRAMSNNAIHDFNMKIALDTIMKEKEDTFSEEENENLKNKNTKWRYSQCSSSSSSTCISKDMLVQNVECQEEVMKVMIVGKTQVGKTKLINNFFETRKNRYIPSSGLEIKKKVVPLINKKVRIEFFDTDANFHLKETSKIYYKICDSFIYLVDCTRFETFYYIQSVHTKIFDNSSSTTFILLLINNHLISRELEKLIKEYSKEYQLTLFKVNNLDEFHLKTESVNHLFSAMLIKKLTWKAKSKFKKHGIKMDKVSPTSNSFSVPTYTPVDSGFGFNNSYQIENYNAFNNDTVKGNNPSYVKRRWSFYDFSSLK